MARCGAPIGRFQSEPTLNVYLRHAKYLFRVTGRVIEIVGKYDIDLLQLLRKSCLFFHGNEMRDIELEDKKGFLHIGRGSLQKPELAW